MTHPLTPREKVEPFERYPALASWIAKMASVGSRLSLGEWMTFVGALNAAIVQAEQRTALASGSGDHAELARLADDLRKFEHHAVGSLKISMDEVRRIIAVCDAHAALLAENAALRAEHVHLVEQKEGAEDALFNALSRATEAERKLAEAVGHVEQLVDRLHSIRDSSIVLIDARTFLSKEAERG